MLSTLFPPYKALSTACREDRFAELPSRALSSAGRRDTLHYYNTATAVPEYCHNTSLSCVSRHVQAV